MLERTLGMRRDRLQLAQRCQTLLRIALLHARAVAAGLGEDLLERHRPALPLVEVEQARALAAQHAPELVGQAEGVVDAAIHAHAARRAVEARGIAGKQYPPDAIAVDHPLVDAIRSCLQHLIALRARHDALHLALDGVGFERGFHRLVVVWIERDAPFAGQAQQAEGAGRRPAVIDAGKAVQVRRKVEARGSENRGFREGHAFEAECQRLAHRAARAIGADQVSALELHRLAAALHRKLHRIRRLRYERGARVEPQLARQLRDQHARELPLLALHAVGMMSVILKEREIELRALAAWVHTHLPRRRDQSLADERRGDAKLFQHVERRRMKSRCAQLLVELPLRLDDERIDAGARELERACQPDGAGADDDDVRSAHFSCAFWPAISAAGISILPSRCPQRFGVTWSSSWSNPSHAHNVWSITQPAARRASIALIFKPLADARRARPRRVA